VKQDVLLKYMETQRCKSTV